MAYRKLKYHVNDLSIFLVKRNVVMLSKMRCRFWNKVHGFIIVVIISLDSGQIAKKFILAIWHIKSPMLGCYESCHFYLNCNLSWFGFLLNLRWLAYNQVKFHGCLPHFRRLSWSQQMSYFLGHYDNANAEFTLITTSSFAVLINIWRMRCFE